MPAQLRLRKQAVPRRPKPEDAVASPRLLSLLDAAEEIFLAKGYHTATMNDVAKAAGMSKKTVYQIIDSKADLFAALLAHYQTLLRFPQSEPEWTVSDILVENLICLGRFLLAPDQIAMVRLIMAEYTHSPDLSEIFHQKRMMKARSRLENCLRDVAKARGVTLPNARETAAVLFGMALGDFLLGALIGFRGAPGGALLRRRVRAAVDLFLGGCDCFSAPPAKPAAE